MRTNPSLFVSSLPSESTNAFDEISVKREFRSNSRVASRGSESDIPPDSNANSNAKERVTPMNQEHEDQLYEKLQKRARLFVHT